MVAIKGVVVATKLVGISKVVDMAWVVVAMDSKALMGREVVEDMEEEEEGRFWFF